MIWSPILMTRPDGSHYGLHTYYQRHAFGDWHRIELQGGFEHADGRREPYAALVPDLDVDPVNRRLRGGVLHATMSDGNARDLTITALSATGFHLGAGLYFGFDGHWHGEWRGRSHIDGEYIAGLHDIRTSPSSASTARLHRAGRRSGGRRYRGRQLAEHRRRSASGARTGRAVVVHVRNASERGAHGRVAR